MHAMRVNPTGSLTADETINIGRDALAAGHQPNLSRIDAELRNIMVKNALIQVDQVNFGLGI